jgi:hypothetical protein
MHMQPQLVDFLVVVYWEFLEERGVYLGVSGEVQVTPFFITTSTSGDLFLDAAFYSVNATLLS